MPGRTKIKPTMFLAYDYDKEEDYINSMANKGWQLKKGGLFHHTYVKNDRCYRYKLDYNNKVHFNMDEYDRYLTIYNEQGWEHINSTFNGWHYFRKKYDPALSEEDYNIYTDDTSLMEMLGRWNKIARILQVIYLIYFFVYAILFANSNTLVAGINCILFLIAIALFEVGILNMKRKRVSAKPRPSLGIYGGYLLIGALFLTLFLTMHLTFHPSYSYKIDYSTQINQNTPDYERLLTIKRKGNYALDVRGQSDRGIVMVRIKKDDKVLYNAGGSEFTATTHLNLKPGNYTVYVIYYLEDYKEEFQASQSELQNLNLTGDLNKMSDVTVFVGIRR